MGICLGSDGGRPNLLKLVRSYTFGNQTDQSLILPLYCLNFSSHPHVMHPYSVSLHVNSLLSVSVPLSFAWVRCHRPLHHPGHGIGLSRLITLSHHSLSADFQRRCRLSHVSSNKMLASPRQCPHGVQPACGHELLLTALLDASCTLRQRCAGSSKLHAVVPLDGISTPAQRRGILSRQLWPKLLRAPHALVSIGSSGSSGTRARKKKRVTWIIGHLGRQFCDTFPGANS